MDQSLVTVRNLVKEANRHISSHLAFDFSGLGDQQSQIGSAAVQVIAAPGQEATDIDG
jgi:hypothetical protein